MEEKLQAISDGARKLDVTTTSMDLVQLNNLVVSMRPTVRKCKVDIIHKLVRQIRQIRKKKGTEEQIAANSKKADRLGEDILAIKKLAIDRTAKKCLANKIPFKDFYKQLNHESRAILRIACHSVMTNKVTAWREGRDDWESLAAFLLYKNTGRRYKKPKKKRSRKVGNEVTQAPREAEGAQENSEGTMEGKSDTEESEDGVKKNASIQEECGKGLAKKKKMAVSDELKEVESESESGDGMDDDEDRIEDVGQTTVRSGMISISDGSEDENTFNQSGDEDGEKMDIVIVESDTSESASSDCEEVVDDSTSDDSKSSEESMDINVHSELPNAKTSRERPNKNMENITNVASATKSKMQIHRDTRSKHPALEDTKSKHPALEDTKSKHPALEDTKSKHPAQEDSEAVVTVFSIADLDDKTEDLDFIFSSNSNLDKRKSEEAKESGKMKIKDSFFCNSDSEDSDSGEQLEGNDVSHDAASEPSGKRHDARQRHESMFIGTLGGSSSWQGQRYEKSDRGRGHGWGRGRGQNHEGGNDRGRGFSRGQGHDGNRGYSRGQGHDRGRGSNRGRGQDVSRGYSRGQGQVRGRGFSRDEGRDGGQGYNRGRGHSTGREYNPSSNFSSRGSSRNNHDSERGSHLMKSRRPGDFSQSYHGDKPSKRPAETVESMHPSWAASKRRQEQQSQSFQGKKTTFDD